MSENAGLDLTFVTSLLARALEAHDERAGLIRQFQNYIWSLDRSALIGSLGDTLVTLAYDLEFYEPDPGARAEDPVYYGDERAEAEIRSFLRKVHDK